MRSYDYDDLYLNNVEKSCVLKTGEIMVDNTLIYNKIILTEKIAREVYEYVYLRCIYLWVFHYFG